MDWPLPQGLRELVISRGRSGYLALYCYDEHADIAAAPAVHHRREQEAGRDSRPLEKRRLCTAHVEGERPGR